MAKKKNKKKLAYQAKARKRKRKVKRVKKQRIRFQVSAQQFGTGSGNISVSPKVYRKLKRKAKLKELNALVEKQRQEILELKKQVDEQEKAKMMWQKQMQGVEKPVTFQDLSTSDLLKELQKRGIKDIDSLTKELEKGQHKSKAGSLPARLEAFRDIIDYEEMLDHLIAWIKSDPDRWDQVEYGMIQIGVPQWKQDEIYNKYVRRR